MGSARITVLSDQPVYTVSQLTRQLQLYLESEYQDIQVEGEVSGVKISNSAHIYFSLKDEGAVLSCVIWKSTQTRIRAELADGQMVRVTGSLTIYPPRGIYQLMVSKVQLAGEGLLRKRFEELKRRLAAEGLFDEARKRPIPVLPRRVAVITSPTGAAIRDFLRIVSPGFAGLEIDIFPVRVQGVEAVKEIASALHALNVLAEHDVLVLTRGGGSLEDLWAFNEEAVARAIAASRIPVISAVGHEIDFTIADFVADLRVPTPTAAAALLVRNRENLAQKLDATLKGLIQYTTRQLETRRQQLTQLEALLIRFSPLSRIAFYRQGLDDLLERMRLLADNRLKRWVLCVQQLLAWLQRGGPERLQRRRQALMALTRQLQTLSPRATLQRGYSVTALEKSGQILRDSSQTTPGERIRTRLCQGELQSQVLEVNHGR